MEEKQKERLLTRQEVEERVGHSCSWIYAMVAKQAFPAPLRLAGTTSVRWLESSIDEYIENQIEGNKNRDNQGGNPAFGHTGKANDQGGNSPMSSQDVHIARRRPNTRFGA